MVAALTLAAGLIAALDAGDIEATWTANTAIRTLLGAPGGTTPGGGD
jgi:hypothetical protein